MNAYTLDSITRKIVRKVVDIVERFAAFRAVLPVYHYIARLAIWCFMDAHRNELRAVARPIVAAFNFLKWLLTPILFPLGLLTFTIRRCTWGMNIVMALATAMVSAMFFNAEFAPTFGGVMFWLFVFDMVVLFPSFIKRAQ